MEKAELPDKPVRTPEILGVVIKRGNLDGREKKE